MGNSLNVVTVFMKAAKCIANRPAGNLSGDRHIQTGGSSTCCCGSVWFCYQKEQPTPICTVAPVRTACRSIRTAWVSAKTQSSTHTVRRRHDATAIWSSVCDMLFLGILLQKVRTGSARLPKMIV